ncbi:hypothetical protein EV356DRAFT_536839 [Viridothelium virens]|uniref:Uncharacterized protein n=1 Tax=Viridothelium virens TaxID=1048519 RepID=A0A6A6GVV0_VIRVR|nr:hypothetical protein EV356DRAFT_536839 [Viridothelium virens]
MAASFLRGRSNPSYDNAEEEGEEEEERLASASFQEAVPGKFRTRVNEYQNQSKFPTAPLYKVNEVVYLVVPGQAQPSGPFLVTAVEENDKYRIRRQDNGQAHPGSVPQASLVVPA